MDIFRSKYTSYFHDGGLISVKHEKNCIDISMASAEINPKEDIEDNIPLGESYHEFKVIKGTLHINNVKTIFINDEPFLGMLNDLNNNYDSGEIKSFDLKDGVLQLAIQWENYPPRENTRDFSMIIIHADEITWEYIPDLPDSP